MFQTNSGIDDAELAAARETIGVPLRLADPFNTTASLDTIRHFAIGYGDDNPLWTDRARAAAQGYPGVIAPPTFLYSVFPPGIGPCFDGLQGFHAGSRWEFARPIVEGESIQCTATLTGIDDVIGRRSGRTLIQHGLAEYRAPDGELLATNASRLFRKPRPGSEGAMNVEPPKPYVLSESDLDALEKEILGYHRRGDVPRYFEDAQVDEELDERVKGPLTLNDIIAFSVGIGNVVGGELALKARAAIAAHPDEAPNNRPLGWLLERVNPGAGHMDPAVARAVGMPAVYDNGWLRMCWMGQLVTDWMGDAAQLKVLDVKLRLPNIVGDVLRMTGKITELRLEAGQGLADLAIEARRQDGEVSCAGTATVQLPRRG